MDSMIPRVNRRPGKLWAFLQSPLVRLCIGFAAIAAAAVLVFWVASTLHLHGIAAAVAQLFAGLAAFGVYLAYVHGVERREATELALQPLLPQVSKGFLIGAALFAVTIGILWLSGAYQVLGMNPTGIMLAPFLGALGAALLEEIAVRGVVFRILEEKLGTWLALALSAAVYGLMHGLNPGASWNSVAAIALESGILLAAAFVYARNLWLGIGLHCAWNFTEGGVFGASVSGGKGHGLLIAQFQGPIWLTGGQFGPEASLVAVLVCIPATITLLLLAQRRGHIMAPFWRKSRNA